MGIETRLNKIEDTLKTRFGITIPGTELIRVVLTKNKCNDEEIIIMDGEDHSVSWRLLIGNMSDSYKLFYGVTIPDALDKAEKWLSEKWPLQDEWKKKGQ